MFDKDAIQELAQAEAISATQAAVDAALGETVRHGIVGLPDTYKIHDFEQHLPTRRRARGTMTTAVLSHFAAYVADHAEEGATVFVDEVQMQAAAVLNLGTPTKPGHADSKAVLALDNTAAYSALRAVLHRSNGIGLSQRELAEFMEDWIDCIECCDRDGSMASKHAIDAIRKITVESARKVESTEGQLSAERSSLERVAASSAGNPLPTSIIFSCVPYHGLAARKFEVRLSIRTGDASKPALSLALRAVKAEQHAEEMAAEFAGQVSDALSGGETPVYVGSYSTKV